MKQVFFVLFVLLLGIAPVAAQDEPPTSEPEATAEVTAAPVVDVVVDATPEPAVEPAEELPATLALYRDIVVYTGAFVLTVLIIMTGVIGGLIKTNSTIAKYAAENIPQTYFDTARNVGSYAEGLAKTLTPNWQGDDEVVKKLQAQIEELRGAIFRTESPDTLADDGKAVG